MNALDMVLMEGALVAPGAIGDERHGDGVGLSEGVDEGVCLESLGGPYAGRGIDEFVAIRAVDVLAASSQFGSTRLLDTRNDLQMHPALGVNERHFVNDGLHHLDLQNRYDRTE